MKNEIVNLLNKFNISCFFIALFHWGISFFTDRLIFSDISNKCFYIGYKIIFLFLLILIWHTIFYIIKNFKTNENIKSFIKISFVYFFIMMFFLLLSWPGIWRCDEFNILNSVMSLRSDLWQGFLISKLYVLFLMLLPFPSGIIIIQNLIISLVVGYSFLKVCQYLCNTKLKYLILIPFFLLPIIDNNLYPMRTTLYAYFILLVSIKVFFLEYDNKLSFKDISAVLILCLLISLMRLEGIIFLLFIPILMLIVFRHKINKKQFLYILLTTIFFLFISLFVKNNIIGNSDNKRYEIYSMLRPMSNLYVNADDEMKKKVIPDIESMIDLDNFLKGSQCNIHDENVLKDFNLTKYKSFKKTYSKLILNNPTTFIKERYNLFRNSVDNIWETVKIFDKNNEGYKQYNNIIQKKSFLPINEDLRKKFISFIERRSLNNYYEYRFAFSFFYNVKIPTIIMLFVLLFSLILKKHILSLLSIIFFIHTFAVFLTAPVTLFIYYLYLYLTSYVFLIIIFLCMIYKTKNEI